MSSVSNFNEMKPFYLSLGIREYSTPLSFNAGLPGIPEFGDRIAVVHKKVQSVVVNNSDAFKGRDTVKSVVVRKEFPEAWIWDAIDDNGCV